MPKRQPDRVVASLNIPNGATIVDLGAGVGYFTWRLAKRVGPEGRVIAVDIQPGMIERLQANLAERGVENVQVVLSEPDNPLLPFGEVDLVLLVDVYHELAFPEAMMEHVRRSLKPDGRVGDHRVPQRGPRRADLTSSQDDGRRSAFGVGADGLSASSNEWTSYPRSTSRFSKTRSSAEEGVGAGPYEGFQRSPRSGNSDKILSILTW